MRKEAVLWRGARRSSRQRETSRLQNRPMRLFMEAVLFLFNLVGWGLVVIMWASILWGPRP